MSTKTTLGGDQTTLKRKMEEIQACLMDDKVTKIGVCGMGGIGKTTVLELIRNNFLKENKFMVIWVNVPKDSNIRKLQNKIALELRLDFREDSDEETRRSELHELFNEIMRKYVLVLDDLRGVYPLEKVGIPKLTPGSKLVLTSRSRDVCYAMSCESIIEMEVLSEKEALSLFFDTVRPNTLIDAKLEAIVKEIVRECAYLPLAVVTVAGSLKAIADSNKWEFVLQELRLCTQSSNKSTEKIFEILKFSYDRLNDNKLQNCLLYCALYSEDYPIERNSLIDQLIAKGMIEKDKTREEKKKMRQYYRMKKGQIMLDALVNVCLLSNTTNNNEGIESLKMHDLIREMAIQVTSNDSYSPRFLVEGGEGWETVPCEEEWKEDLVEVSLMGNDIKEIPSDLKPPNCPALLTMFLNDNRHLRSISSNFFLHMKGLNVLDISYTSIGELPESVSDLVSLGVLMLRGCWCLGHVPSLAKLTNLRRLDLSSTHIHEVPRGLEMLIRLRHLDLAVDKLNWTLADGILSS